MAHDVFAPDVNVPPPPPPTPQETELQQMTVDLLKQQVEEGKILRPAILAQLGYKGQFDESGKLTSIERMSNEELFAQMTPLEQQQYTVAQETASRQLKALRGELEIDPALSKELEDQERTLRESLSRRLGLGWEASTVGQDALRRFQESATRIRESARRGQIEMGQGLLTQAEASATGLRQAEIARTAGVPALFSTTRPGTAELNAAQQPYQFQREMEWQTNMERSRQEFAHNKILTDFYRELTGYGLSYGSQFLPAPKTGSTNAGSMAANPTYGAFNPSSAEWLMSLGIMA